MSIATELTRMAQNAASVDAAKAAIASAITAKGGTVGQSDGLENFPAAIAGIPSGGITPSGKKLITDTSETDVAAFATAQISSDTLLAENIKKNVNILGVVGSFEGGGGMLHESGTIDMHTGTNDSWLRVPISNSTYSHYLCVFYATNTWWLIDGVWVKQDSLDFTDIVADSMVNNGLVTIGITMPFVGAKNKSGNAIASDNYRPIIRRLFGGASTGIGTIGTTNRPNECGISSGNINIRYDPAWARFCTADCGMTWAYEVWGWN